MQSVPDDLIDECTVSKTENQNNSKTIAKQCCRTTIEEYCDVSSRTEHIGVNFSAVTSELEKLAAVQPAQEQQTARVTFFASSPRMVHGANDCLVSCHHHLTDH